MLNDPFSQFADSPTAPAEYCFPIIPDDSSEVAHATKALYVGQGGDVTLLSLRGDADVVFRNVASGTTLDVRARAVRASGTTASELIGLA